MTSTEIVTVDAYARASLDERKTYVQALAQAGDLLPKTLWENVRREDGSVAGQRPSPGKVLLMAETGAMLGIHPMAALQGIHIIEGKPSLSANLLAALVRRAGHRLRVSTRGSWADGTFVARAELTRADDPDFTFVVEWGVERAQRAGLTNKSGPWRTYPEAMSKSRAITEVIREGAPDVTLVPAYSPEELGATNVDESGELIVENIVAEGTKVTQPQTPQGAAEQPQTPPTQDDVTEATIEPDDGVQPQPEPVQRQADIVDAEEVTSTEDWVARVGAAGTAEDVLAIYREARLKGELKATIEFDGEQHELGPWIVSVGTALREAEMKGMPDQGAPAVLGERDEHTTGGSY
ncbi:RecT-like ssDNA binding protein [Microbacterium phage Pickles13]|nr:RecT-like ssDNA binding protein [Microbacterium phage Pickles13]